MRTFATFATAGTYAAGAAGEVLVGRTVANTGFLKALLRHGSFERVVLLVGESGDVPVLEKVLAGTPGAERVAVANVLALPELLASGAISVLHHASHLDRFFDLLWLRDRHASGPVPVTAQIHTLSYARSIGEYLRSFVCPPTLRDAIFCSSTGGREVVRRAFASLAESLAAAGRALPLPEWELPVQPLGIDVESCRHGDRAGCRASLGIPADARVVLSIARFTEYDKADLFPLLQAVRGCVDRLEPGGPPVHLLLAGARQGTGTPEMLQLWARLLGLGDRLHLDVDFPEERKRDLLAAADVFVSPVDSPQETFGLSVVEAMAAGLPVVVSDFDGYRDTVPDDVGIRVPTRWGGDLGALSDLGPILYERPLHLLLGQSVEVDLRALEDALVRLLGDELSRRRFGKAAAARAEGVYDWKPVIAGYERVWDELAARAVPPRAVPARHPLGMDYRRVFGHYPTAWQDPDRVVVRTELGRLLCAEKNGHPIYPELKNVFGDDDVVVALAAAQRPIRLGVLAGALKQDSPGRPSWQLDLLLAWLLKHGLLAGAGPREV